MNLTMDIVLWVASGLLGFLAGSFTAKAFYVRQWNEAREQEALRRARVLSDARRSYPAREGVNPVKIHTARITGRREKR